MSGEALSKELDKVLSVLALLVQKYLLLFLYSLYLIQAERPCRKSWTRYSEYLLYWYKRYSVYLLTGEALSQELDELYSLYLLYSLDLSLRKSSTSCTLFTCCTGTKVQKYK